MRPDGISIGDPVHDSPVGSGEVTDITDAGYPQVNGIAVAWLERPDGGRFDPYGHKGGNKAGTGIVPEGYVKPPAKELEKFEPWPNSYAAGAD